MAGINMVQLKNISSSKLISQKESKEQLLAICLSKRSTNSTSSASGSECYYYSTLGKKTGWRSYENTMALKTMLSRPLNSISIQDMTPEFNGLLSCDGVSSQKLRSEAGSSKDYKTSFVNHVFRRIPPNLDRHLIIISSQGKSECIWEGAIIDGTLFLRGNGLEHIDLKESIVAIIELAEEWLKCHTLVVCLDKKFPLLSTLIRSFFYVGFELVVPDTYNHNSNDFILVGMEL